MIVLKILNERKGNKSEGTRNKKDKGNKNEGARNKEDVRNKEDLGNKSEEKRMNQMIDLSLEIIATEHSFRVLKCFFAYKYFILSSIFLVPSSVSLASSLFLVLSFLSLHFCLLLHPFANLYFNAIPFRWQGWHHPR